MHADGGRDYWIDRFEDFAMVYLVATRLGDADPTLAGFQSFVLARAAERPWDVAYEQLEEVRRLASQSAPPPWVRIMTEPEDPAESQLACRLVTAAVSARTSPSLRPHPDCAVVFAEYVARGDAHPEGYLGYLVERMVPIQISGGT